MYHKRKFFGRALHPMMVSFPIVLYSAAFVCFCLYQGLANPFWYRVAFIANLIGVCAAILAAIPGSLDLSTVSKDNKARSMGLKHAGLNVASLILFAVNLYLIWGTFNIQPRPNISNVFITDLGLGLTLAASYLGYSLMGKSGLGADDTSQQRITAWKNS